MTIRRWTASEHAVAIWSVFLVASLALGALARLPREAFVSGSWLIAALGGLVPLTWSVQRLLRTALAKLGRLSRPRNSVASIGRLVMASGVLVVWSVVIGVTINALNAAAPEFAWQLFLAGTVAAVLLNYIETRALECEVIG